MLRLLQRLPKATDPKAAGSESEETPLALLEFQSPTSAVIATPTPASASMTGIYITLLVVIMILIAAFMQVEVIVTAQGTLVTSAPTDTISPFNAAIVHSLDVHPGQFVTKGQVLATLDQTDTLADVTALTAQEQGYAAQVAQLQAQEDNKPYIPDPNNPASALQLQTYEQQVAQYNSTLDDYDQKIAALQTEVVGYNDQAAYYKQQIAIASNVQTMRKQLQDMQVGSKLDTLSATSSLVSFQASLASAQSSAIQSQQDEQSNKAQREEFIQQWRANISTQLATAILNLTQTQDQLTKAQVSNNLVNLTAPQDSVVLSVAPVTVGSVVNAGEALIQTVPANAPLSVTAEIDGTESGFVHPGDRVVLKFSTLDFMQYGDAHGVVQSISANSINPSPGATNPSGPGLPGGPTDLYYDAEVSLEELSFHNTPPGLRIVPGMPLEADIVVGHRTVMNYFLRKVMPVAYDSMHEP